MPRSSVSLTVPHGAVRAGSTCDLYVAVLQPDFYRPRLDESQTAMTPVVRCGLVHKRPESIGGSAELLKPGKIIAIEKAFTIVDNGPMPILEFSQCLMMNSFYLYFQLFFPCHISAALTTRKR